MLWRPCRWLRVGLAAVVDVDVDVDVAEVEGAGRTAGLEVVVEVGRQGCRQGERL